MFGTKTKVAREHSRNFPTGNVPKNGCTQFFSYQFSEEQASGEEESIVSVL
jgi:hypothetical protein